MKKSTLLSLLTAGAVIATSAGTFAAWDQTTATVTGELTIDKPVTVTVSALSLERDGGLSQNAPTYKGEVTVEAKDLPATVTGDNYEIIYEAKAYREGDDTKAAVDGVTVTPKEKEPVTSLNQSHTVEVVVETTEAAKTVAEGTTKLNVDVTATLKEKSNPAV